MWPYHKLLLVFLFLFCSEKDDQYSLWIFSATCILNKILKTS